MTISLTPNKAYDELIDFIASGTTPHNVIAFQPSEEVKLRVAHLIAQEKNEELSPEEKNELDNYMVLEHILRLAKAKAYQYLTQVNQ